MLFLGIDPGQHGAIVQLWDDSAIYQLAPIKDGDLDVNQAASLIDVWRHTGNAATERWLAVLEMPPYGYGKATHIKSLVGLHRSHEAWRTILDLLHIQHLSVSPARWQKHHKLNTAGKGQTKKAACALVKTFFGWELDYKDKSDQGIADAALLALYGRQLWKGGQA